MHAAPFDFEAAFREQPYRFRVQALLDFLDALVERFFRVVRTHLDRFLEDHRTGVDVRRRAG